MIFKKVRRIIFLGGLVSLCGVCVINSEPQADTTQQQKSVVKQTKPQASETRGENVAFEGRTDLKVRYIDMYAAMRESKEGAEVSKELENKRKEYAQALETEEKQLNQAMTEYRNKSSMLSESARSKEEQRIAKLKRDYEAKAKNNEEDLKLIMQQKTEHLGRKIEKAVAEIAKRDGLDAVVDKVTGRVIYTSNTSDCTMKITEEMNRQYDVQNASGKKTETRSVAANTK